MIVVKYKIEAFDSLISGGLAISREQSSQGTIDTLNELNLPIQSLPKFACSKLINVRNGSSKKKFSLPIPLELTTRRKKANIFEGEVEIAFYDEIYKESIEGMLNTILGEVHHIADVPLVRVEDIRFCKDLPSYLKGPKFGLSGIRKILGVYHRPLLIAPVKPSMGLKTEYFRKLASEAWKGGADIVKDDELHFYSDEKMFFNHIKLIMEEKRKIEDQTGEKKIYICNVLSSIEDLNKRLHIASMLDVDGVMVCPGIQGFGILQFVMDNYNGIIVSHNSGLTISSRFDKFGISFPLISKIQRMSGADIIITPSPWGTFTINESEIVSSISILSKKNDFWGLHCSLPALAGGEWAGNIYKLFDFFNPKSFAIVSGKGIFCHPSGPRAGANSIREAIDINLSGGNVWEHINDNSDLGKSLRTFGRENSELSSGV